jgi:hypothetical protein
MAEHARMRGFGSPAVQPVWIGVGVPPDFFWVGSFWVNGFVGKARWRHLETQWHQEMLVAEGFKESNFADCFLARKSHEVPPMRLKLFLIAAFCRRDQSLSCYREPR